MMDEAMKLKSKLKEQGIQGLALDIDETLSDSHPVWFEHLYKFYAPKNMTREEAMEKYFDSIDHFPEWKTEEANAHIRTALHSNEFNENIPLLAESNKMIRELNKIIPVVAYITVRFNTVRTATERWLKTHGFPEKDLVMNSPDVPFESSTGWKASILKALYPEVIGIVDDNKKLPNELAKLDYKGKVFLYGRQTKQLNPADYKFELIISPTWDHVLDHFKNGKLL